MATVQDTPRYNVGNITVTDSRITTGNQTYHMNEIQSVSFVPPIVRRNYGLALIIVGAIIAIAGYFVWGTLLTPVAAGAILVVAGAAVMAFVRDNYTVRLNRTNGQINELKMPDAAQAQQFVQAVSSAIAERRDS